MARLYLGSTYWSSRPQTDIEHTGRFSDGRLETDVAIVGGGFTGCVLAFVFARAGIPVAVFERAAITRGSTCASTALLMQEPDRGFLELVRRYGA
ncbi:MAG: FAD-dependent oxidoreductase, partial [Acidobacteria bacterium]|nr:FAD-dependent oxidoreductase [Acidobacteriota bacterium]